MEHLFAHGLWEEEEEQLQMPSAAGISGGNPSRLDAHKHLVF